MGVLSVLKRGVVINSQLKEELFSKKSVLRVLKNYFRRSASFTASFKELSTKVDRFRRRLCDGFEVYHANADEKK